MAYPLVRVYVDFTSGAFATASSWTEITNYVYGVDTAYGRSSLLDEFQPGRGRLTLNNQDGRFDPLNVSGAYYPNLRPRNRIKVEATVSEVAYADLFSGSSVDTAIWSQFGSGGVTVSGGLLTNTSSTSATSRGLSAVKVTPFYDLVVTASTVQMTATPWPTSAFFYPVYVRMDAADTEAAWWEITNGLLIASYKQPGVGTDVYSVTHSNVTHAHLRLRRHGHFTMWETSTDGVTWTVRHQQEIAWQEADTAVVRTWVRTTAPEATTDAMSISAIEASYNATHALSYGWVKGWPQTQMGRKIGEVDLEWSDAMTVLARTDLPQSVYDYQVRQNSPVGWWKMADTTPILEDSSGQEQHGLWGTIEERQSPHFDLEQRPLPTSVLKSAHVDAVVPMSGREGMNWAKLQAEVGQPLGGTTDTWRTPVARLGWVSQIAIIPDWTMNLWVRPRQAFPLNITNTVGSSLSPISQPLLTWGEPPFNSSATVWKLYLASSNGTVIFAASNTTGAGGQAMGSSPVMYADQQPHQVSLTYDAATRVLKMYIDGVYQQQLTLTTNNPVPVYRAVVGYAHDDNGLIGEESSLQSAVGDVACFYTEMTAAELLALYRAGRYGSLDASTRLTTGTVVSQALTMIGWTGPTWIDTTGHYCTPDIPGGGSALEYMRKAASSERGAFFQEPNGTLTLLASDWTATLSRAVASHWLLSDNGSTLLSYSRLDFAFDDETIVNEVNVGWADGEQRAEDTASIATFGRLRESIDTILDNPEDALQLANWMTASYAQPRRLVSRPVLVEPTTTADFAFCCSVEFGSRLTLTRTTPDGRTITADYLVQAVSHRIDTGQGAWSTQLTLDPADIPGPLFVLAPAAGAGGSLLDGPAVLAF